MELSRYQKDIVNYFNENPQGNIMVNALAGTGKSFIICELTKNTKTSDVYVAFNSSIADEFKEKIKNPKTKVMTLHSLGLSIMNANLKGTQSKTSGIGVSRQVSQLGAVLDNLKIYKIIDGLIFDTFGKYDRFEHKIFIRENYVQLYNLCRLTCTDIYSEDAVERLIEDYNLFADYSGNDFSMPLISTILDWLEEIDNKSMEVFETTKEIDFTDMLYITYKKLSEGQWNIPYYNYYTNIYCDEAQDLSTLQLFLLKRIKRKNGRYVFVLDENQAIYSFAGGNAKSCSLIPKLFAPIKQFELPINYRCPKSHLKYVNENFNIPIKPRKDAPEGVIKTINKEDIKKYVHHGDLIISRKNKWLSEIILDLATHGIPIFMEDKEMVEQVKKIIASQKADSLYDLKIKLKKIVKKYSDELNKIAKAKTEKVEEETQKIADVIDTNAKIDNINFVESILKFYSSKPSNKYKKPTDFIKYIDELLNTSSTNSCVRICSVHKAKGLEANQTFVLNEAKICADSRKTWEQNKQEENLSYISVTRAKQNLYLVREDEKKQECERE